MRSSPATIIFFPGAGGEVPNLMEFEGSDNNKFEALSYPGWRRYGNPDFTPEALMADLQAQIEARASQGPIQIVGYSIGAHLGYLAGLRLQSAGRDIMGFCILDAFMVESVSPSPGWQRRALAQGMATIQAGHMQEFILFIRSKFYRALLRLSPTRLPNLLCRIDPVGLVGRIVSSDQVFCKELTVHLLVRKIAPWLRELDVNPAALAVPTILLRTRENTRHDEAWRRRCPHLKIFEISGQHQNLFGSENIAPLRKAFAAAMQELG